MIQMQIWQFIVMLLLIILGVGVGVFFLTRWLFQRQLKKNPPINEAMIRAMMTQMGRTPSHKQVRAVMRSKNDAK